MLTEDENSVINVKLKSQDPNLSQQIHKLDVFVVTGDVIVKQYNNLSAEGGLYPLNLEQKDNTRLIFVANGNDISFDPVEGSTTHKEMLSKATPVADYKLSQPLMYYTGSNIISTSTEQILTVDMTKSLARVDLKIQAQTDIVIDSCVISNIVDRGHILPSGNLSHPDAKLISKTLSGKQLTATSTTTQEGLIYLYESYNANSTAVFHAKINGVKNIIKVALPVKIHRNKKHLITINSSGATLSSTLVILPWEEDFDIDAHPEQFKPLIDPINSDFPAVVTINKTRDTIFFPSTGTTGTLVIDADVETELSTDSDITIEPIPNTNKASYVGNQFKITVNRKDLNDPISYSRIYIKNKNATQHYGRHIVVTQPPYRMTLTSLNEEGTITGSDVNFNCYTDGKIANITYSEEPLDVVCETNDLNFNWLLIDKTEPEANEIHGLFKPNDIDAKGQIQESIIKVTYNDGLVEEYKFKRKRESIPTVFIAGQHWAKHNMRGNSKKYEDQISVEEDPEDVYEYLKTCSDADYIFYSGANYKGRSQEGMYLHKDINNVLNYNGYSQYADAVLSLASPYIHCPSGYQLPTKQEIGTILHETGRFGLTADYTAVEYTSNANIRFRLERHKRDNVTIDGILVADVVHTKITDTTTKASLTLAGTGNQYDAANMDFHTIIFGMLNFNDKYFTFNHKENYATIHAHTSPSTRTKVIRCIKSSVKHLAED